MPRDPLPLSPGELERLMKNPAELLRRMVLSFALDKPKVVRMTPRASKPVRHESP